MKKLIRYFRPVVPGVLAVALLCCFGQGDKPLVQALKKELTKAHAFYSDNHTLYMHSTVYGVPVNNSRGQVQLGTAEMYRDGYRFYSKAFGREMYCDGKRALVIHPHKKTATLYQHFDARRMMREQALPVDSLLRRVSNRDSLVQVGGKTNSYRVFRNGNNLAYVDLVFDEKEHYLKAYDYTLYLPETELRSDYSKIQVRYDRVSKKLPIKTNFDIDRFLTGTGNKIRVNEKLLKGYRLVVKRYYYEM